MTAAPARFTFDLDLARSGDRGLVSAGRLATAQQEARSIGYAEGFSDGEGSAAAAAAQHLAAAAEAIAAQAAMLLAAADENHVVLRAEAVALATATAKKLAAHLVAAEPAAELEALLAECLSTLDAVPHLVIRCAPELADAVKETATAAMATSSFAGRLVVMGDPDQHLGNCRLEWVDGGLVRDVDAISAEIDARISAYLAAHGGTGA